jgi:hypothetical protein
MTGDIEISPRPVVARQSEPNARRCRASCEAPYTDETAVSPAIPLRERTKWKLIASPPTERDALGQSSCHSGDIRANQVARRCGRGVPPARAWIAPVSLADAAEIRP